MNDLKLAKLNTIQTKSMFESDQTHKKNEQSYFFLKIPPKVYKIINKNHN